MKLGGFYKKTIRDVPLDGTTVLLRTDYNVPFEDGKIHNDFRIKASLPTIEKLLQRGCKIVIISHLGRPDGRRKTSLSLEPVSKHLGKLLGKKVKFVPDCVGDNVRLSIKRASKNSVILLENLRFYPGEEANDAGFAKSLAEDSGARYFVQDAFGAVHRKHASTSAITSYLPSVSGLLLEKEYNAITNAVERPVRPMVAVVGGAKISDKIQVIERLVELADTVVIGGAIANNFLKYRKYPVGKSLVDKDVDGVIQKVYQAAEKKVGPEAVDDFIVLPEDVAISTSSTTTSRRADVDRRQVRGDEIILDIGPMTMSINDSVVSTAKTVFWNGTLGRADLAQFAYGSARLALALATHSDIVSVVGGGDTADFVLNWDAREGKSFTHVSTGGGASLELIAGKPMPGIDSLMDA